MRWNKTYQAKLTDQSKYVQRYEIAREQIARKAHLDTSTLAEHIMNTDNPWTMQVTSNKILLIPRHTN